MAEPDVTILGIDPGTIVVGVGVLRARGGRFEFLACDAIRAPRSADVPSRLLAIHDALADALARHRPDVVVVEKVFVGKSTPSAIRIGEGRGVALVCAARAGVEIVEYTPATVKRAIAGFGAADKAQMATWIARLLGLARAPEPHDAADALALALTHAHRRPRAGMPAAADRWREAQTPG